MRPIQILYVDYCRQHNGTGPIDAHEFKRFLGAEGLAKVRYLGVDRARIDGWFDALPDRAPLDIHYALPLAMETQVQQVVAHERQARNGKCFAIFVNGSIEQLGTDRMAQLDLKVD